MKLETGTEYDDAIVENKWCHSISIFLTMQI